MIGKLNPYAKAIHGAVAAAASALLAAELPWPTWAKGLLTLIVTVSSVYFVPNTTPKQAAGRPEGN